MWFLYDNITAVAVAVVTCAFAWLFAGTLPGAVIPVMPWLCLVLVEVMICYPQRHFGESTYEARGRVWRAMRRDPLVWIAALFILLLAVPFVNKGLCPICDYPALNFDNAKDAVKYLPFCVNLADHLDVFLWFAPSLAAMVAVRHSLLKRGKRLLVEMIVWNGLALSFIGVLQSATGAAGPLWTDIGDAKVYFFSTFGYPNMAGDYFTTLFALSVAVWRRKTDEARERLKSGGGEGGDAAKANHRVFWSKHLYAIPAAVFFLSTMITLSRASMLLLVTLSLLFYAHALACHLKRMSSARKVKTTALNLGAFVVMATVFLIFMSDNVRQMIARTDPSAPAGDAESAETAPAAPARTEDDYAKKLDRELGTIDTFAILDRLSGHGQYHVRVATEIWKKYPVFGCGGWGYKHLSIPEMTDGEYARFQKVGGANVHNDPVQFLCEHGALGVVLLVTMLVMLVWPLGRVWKAIIASVRFQKPKDQPPRPLTVFALPAPVFCILLSAVATLVHSLGDCPLRSPAVLSLLFVSLAATDGFMPRIKED